MSMKVIFAVLLATWMLVGPAAAQPAPPLGAWVTASGNLEVEIAPCGQVLCGTVVRVRANRSMADSSAEAAVPPAAVGLRLISDLRQSGAEWRGRILNRENGRVYDCVVQPLANGQLSVRPYIVLPLFGKTQIWRRPTPAAPQSRR